MIIICQYFNFISILENDNIFFQKMCFFLSNTWKKQNKCEKQINEMMLKRGRNENRAYLVMMTRSRD